MSKLEQEVEAESIKEYGLLVLSLALSASFLIQHRTTLPRVVLPTVGWALLHWLIIKENPPQVTLISAVPQLRLSSQRILTVVLRIDTLVPGQTRRHILAAALMAWSVLMWQSVLRVSTVDSEHS